MGNETWVGTWEKTMKIPAGGGGCQVLSTEKQKSLSVLLLLRLLRLRLHLFLFTH